MTIFAIGTLATEDRQARADNVHVFVLMKHEREIENAEQEYTNIDRPLIDLRGL